MISPADLHILQLLVTILAKTKAESLSDAALGVALHLSPEDGDIDKMQQQVLSTFHAHADSQLRDYAHVLINARRKAQADAIIANESALNLRSAEINLLALGLAGLRDDDEDPEPDEEEE